MKLNQILKLPLFMDAAQLWSFIIAAWAFVSDLNWKGSFCKAYCMGLVVARLANPTDEQKGVQMPMVMITPCISPTFHSNRPPFWAVSLQNSSPVPPISPGPLLFPEPICTYLGYWSNSFIYLFIFGSFSLLTHCHPLSIIHCYNITIREVTLTT